MRKHARKILCILLALCLMSISVFATDVPPTATAESIIQPRFTYICYASVGLGINSAGKASCDTDVTLYDYGYSVKITMNLQRYEDSDWENVKTWTLTADGPNVDLIKYWYVLSGYDYRIMSDIYVYNANNQIIEITTEYSPIVEY